MGVLGFGESSVRMAQRCSAGSGYAGTVMRSLLSTSRLYRPRTAAVGHSRHIHVAASSFAYSPRPFPSVAGQGRRFRVRRG